MDQDKFEYWMEGIVLAVFEHLHPEYAKSGAHAVQMMEAIDKANKKEEEAKHWNDFGYFDKITSIDKAFRRMSRKRTLWTTEENGEEVKRIIDKKLIRVGKVMGDPVYAPYKGQDKPKKVESMRPSAVTRLTKIDKYKFE